MEELKAREHIALLDDTELHELIKLAAHETSQEGRIIYFLLVEEQTRRKFNDEPKKFND